MKQYYGKITSMNIVVLNGPNLNLLGCREPEIYGYTTLVDIESQLREQAARSGVDLEFFQSNHEGVIIDYIQASRGRMDGLVINPGALAHYSIALRDTLAAVDCPVIEIHISNIYSREDFRRHTVTAAAVTGQISGLGVLSYRLGLEAAIELAKQRQKNGS